MLGHVGRRGRVEAKPRQAIFGPMLEGRILNASPMHKASQGDAEYRNRGDAVHAVGKISEGHQAEKQGTSRLQVQCTGVKQQRACSLTSHTCMLIRYME